VSTLSGRKERTAERKTFGTATATAAAATAVG